MLENRLLLVQHLAESLEFSRLALAGNDAEAIARGAAHQTELCRRWALLEDQLRSQYRTEPVTNPPGSEITQHSADVSQQWNALEDRIRYITRVHCSLLRHMQRSLAVLDHLIEKAAPTYHPAPLARPTLRLQAGE